ncbi:MAG TPA: hypothetical protein VGJ69_06110, partial [Pyrinomonadaceae bacterium]
NSKSNLNSISDGKLAPTFSAYEESERGKIDANGRKLRRLIYRWNEGFTREAVEPQFDDCAFTSDH